MNLPTREEINIHGSLDEQHACKIFFGKTLKEAELLFHENALAYSEDLMWMGPIAFRYYVHAYVHYLQSSESNGDSDAINCFVGLLEFRLQKEPQELRPVSLDMEAACRYVIENFERFNAGPEIYGDLRSRYEKAIRVLSTNL